MKLAQAWSNGAQPAADSQTGALTQTSKFVVTDVIPPVIERTVPDVGDLAGGEVEDLGNIVCHIEHSALFLGAYVVDLAGDAFVQNAVEGLRHILNKEVASSSSTCNSHPSCCPFCSSVLAGISICA